MSEKTQCPDGEGTGDCSECRGNGYAIDEIEQAGEACDACGGSGECETCGGTGSWDPEAYELQQAAEGGRGRLTRRRFGPHRAARRRGRSHGSRFDRLKVRRVL